MTGDPNAPDRLVSSADDAGLRALLEAGREELPSARQLEALATKLGPVLGPGGTGGHGGPDGGQIAATAAKKLGGAALAKAITAAALATVLGVSAVHAVKGRAREEGAPPVPTASAAAATTAPPPPEPSAAPPADSAAAIAPGPAPRTAPSSRATPPASAAVDDPDAEVQLLQRAQDALPSDPARSLALAAEHARRFPKGLLTQEREVLAIEALVHLGRASEARARADRFRATYPSSTHLQRIDSVLDGKP